MNEISAFWSAHGETIKSIVSNAWSIVKTVISTAISTIGNTIKLIAQVINGDWAGAWETTKTILTNVGKAWGSILAGAAGIIWNGLKLAFNVLSSIQGRVAEQAVLLGAAAVRGIIDGILNGIGVLGEVINSVLKRLFEVKKVDILSIDTVNLGENITKLKTELELGAESIRSIPSPNIFDSWSDSFSKGIEKAVPIINQSGAQLQKTLDDLSKNTNLSPEFKKKLQNEITRIGSNITEAAAHAKSEIQVSFADLQNTLNNLLANPQISNNFRNAINNELNLVSGQIRTKSGVVGTSLTAGINQGISSNSQHVQNSIKKLAEIPDKLGSAESKAVGVNISSSFAKGIVENGGSVINAAISIAEKAIDAAKKVLGIASPSKVFYAIGKDVVQGYVDGINALKASSQSAMASVLDISNIKTIKNDKAGVELLTSLINETARFNVVGKEQETLLALTGSAYKKLNPKIKEAILLASQRIDSLNATKTATQQLGNAFERLASEFAPKKSDLETINEFFKNSEAVAEYAKSIGKTADEVIRLGRAYAIAKENLIIMNSMQGAVRNVEDSGITIKKPTQIVADNEPPPSSTLNFWKSILSKISEMQSKLPSLKETMSSIFVDLPSKAGNILVDALTKWDGSFKGFFTSVAKGFGQLITEIINQLLRMIVVQAIMSMLSATFGGGSGSWGSKFSTSFTGGLGIGKKAKGGLISGEGSGTSDSILSWLSNGEFVVKADAVKKFGAGFFASLNNMQMPAFAGGGLVSSNSFDTPFIPSFDRQVINEKNDNKKIINQTVNINAKSGALATPKSRRQTAEAMISAMKNINRNGYI